jgi:hypothetical protein
MEYSPEMQRIYSRWYNSADGEWGVEPFFDYLKSKGWKMKGYGGDSEPLVENIYNGENALDGVFLYGLFHAISPSGLTDFYGVMVSTHNGCDMRGGYSGFKFFTTWDHPFSDPGHVVLSCRGPELPEVDPAQGILPLENLPERDMSRHYWESYSAGYSFKPCNDYSDSGEHDTPITAATAAVESLDEYRYAELRCPVCGGKMTAHWY